LAVVNCLIGFDWLRQGAFFWTTIAFVIVIVIIYVVGACLTMGRKKSTPVYRERDDDLDSQ
jgi:hypothetical protein